jgi:hypothetical protein
LSDKSASKSNFPFTSGFVKSSTGFKGEIEVDEKVVIWKLDPRNKKDNNRNRTSNAEKNLDAVIIIRLTTKRYKAVFINYIPSTESNVNINSATNSSSIKKMVSN